MIRAHALRVSVATAVLIAALGVVAAFVVDSSTPVGAQTCPAGTTLDASGNCSAPATGVCPAGFTVSGTTCTRPGCPPGSFAVDPSVGAPEPGCFDPGTVTFTGISDPAFFCPAGTTFTFPDPLLGPDPGACNQPATFTCATGTLSGQVCLTPALAGCEGGIEIAGICHLPGTSGDAFANGGDGGDARGGDGGRGGTGTGATCNQSTNDTIWQFDDEPSVDCGTGGRGGDAGDGGISEGGDGGLAFTDSFF